MVSSGITTIFFLFRRNFQFVHYLRSHSGSAFIISNSNFFSVAIFILARHSLYLILSIEQLRLDVLPSSTTLSMLALNFKILQGIMTNDEFICWDDSAQIKSEHIVGIFYFLDLIRFFLYF